jgi:hypothetical protein
MKNEDEAVLHMEGTVELSERFTVEMSMSAPIETEGEPKLVANWSPL